MKPHFRKLRGQWQVLWRDGHKLKIRDLPLCPAYWLRTKKEKTCNSKM